MAISTLWIRILILLSREYSAGSALIPCETLKGYLLTPNSPRPCCDRPLLGRTPPMLSYSPPCRHLCRDHSASPTAVDAAGDTPLHLACLRADDVLAALLLGPHSTANPPPPLAQPGASRRKGAHNFCCHELCCE